MNNSAQLWHCWRHAENLGRLKASTAGQKARNIKGFPVNEIESYKRTSRGTTFLILSDISTLGATKGVKAIAAGIVDQMDSDDNAGLLVNGYTAEQIEVSDRILELKNQIEGDLFKRNANVKNLNETASVALSFLEQHKRYAIYPQKLSNSFLVGSGPLAVLIRN